MKTNLQINKLSWLVLGFSLALVHCSGVKFGTQSGQTAAGSAGSGTKSANGGDASGSLNQGGSGGGGASGSLNQGANPGGSGGSGAGGGTTGGGGTGTGGAPGGNSGGTIASTDSPKVRFVGPPCIRGTNCLVEFDLDAAVAHNFDFDWRTNDTLYQKPGAPAGYTYGQPGVHYVATSGHITFLAGETVKQVYVQNINPYNIQIIIGVNMSVCTYNGNLGNCTDFFH